MKKYYRPDFGFEKDCPGISDKQLAAEGRKFTASLAAFSRDDLVQLLANLVLANSAYETVLKIKDKHIATAEKHANALFQHKKFLELIADHQTQKLHLRNQPLNVGRKIGAEKRKAERDEIEGTLKKAIVDYISAKAPRKVSNKELENFLMTKGFISTGNYKPSTLQKKIGLLAAQARKESSGQ